MPTNVQVGELSHTRWIFVPLVSDARSRLRQQITGTLYDLLTDKAHAEWEGHLLKRLCLAGRRAVAQRFQTFCSARSAFKKECKDQQLNEDSAYHEFVGNDPTARLEQILNEFPGLARISETLIENWVSTVREFLERLRHDLDGLANRFEGGEFRCPIDDLQVGLSDPHRGGRCVVRIRFPSSVALIYKPRSLAPEVSFFALLEEWNGDVPPYALRLVRCWDRDTHGWMEDVAPQPCKEQGELRAFYWRAGALLALVYLARGVDIHMENLIAAGGQPVLIDLETLWHPQEHLGAGDDPIAHTVLRTGFLPQRDPLTGAAYEQNALSHRAASISRGSRHLPTFEGAAYPASDFLTDILGGFRWIGEQVFEEHQLRGEFQLWVRTLTQCRRRRILRSTAWYRSVIEQMIAPPSLRNVVSLAAGCFEGRRSDPPITEEEGQSLLQLDVPYIEQAAGHEEGQEAILPVQNIDDFLKQEGFIINALTPAVNEDGL